MRSAEHRIAVEAKSLPPWAEPVEGSELRQGETYFSLYYCDDELLVPFLAPMVFIGLDREPGDNGVAYFQDLTSYLEGVRYGEEKGGSCAEFESGQIDEMQHIFHFDRALDELLRCEIRRRSRSRTQD
jgi:hypothetical protein